MKADNESHSYRESRLLSVLKACSWRLVATSTTFVIVYVVTGKFSFATSIAGVEIITKMIIYYLHERAWQLVSRETIGRVLRKQKHNNPDAGDGK